MGIGCRITADPQQTRETYTSERGSHIQTTLPHNALHTLAGAGVFFFNKALVLTAIMRPWDDLLATLRAVPLIEEDMELDSVCILISDKQGMYHRHENIAYSVG